MVFLTGTLIEMAAYFRQREASLMSINGVVEMKAMLMGDEFLAVIRSYCKQNAGLDETAPRSSCFTRTRGGGDLNRRYLISGRLMIPERQPTRWMRRFQIKLTTIIDHLKGMYRDGNSSATLMICRR